MTLCDSLVDPAPPLSGTRGDLKAGGRRCRGEVTLAGHGWRSPRGWLGASLIRPSGPPSPLGRRERRRELAEAALRFASPDHAAEVFAVIPGPRRGGVCCYPRTTPRRCLLLSPDHAAEVFAVSPDHAAEVFAVIPGPRRGGVCCYPRATPRRCLLLSPGHAAEVFAVIPGPRRGGVCCYPRTTPRRCLLLSPDLAAKV